MTKINHFGDLGNDFQKKLIAQIVDDINFALAIIPILEIKYFDNTQCKRLYSIIKDYNNKYVGQIPSLTGLKEQVLSVIKDDIEKLQLIELLKELPQKTVQDASATKDMSLDFCKHQEMIKAISEAQKIIKKQDFNSYPEIRTIINDALNVGEREKDTFDILDNIDKALEDDYRNPIPTGVDGLDDSIGGGLGKKEFGILIMPTGTGKTTLLTKFANTAYKKGYNVLQIFFEDNVPDIQRKHMSALTNFSLNDLSTYKDIAKDKILETSKGAGILTLKKYSSDSTTVSDIKQFLSVMKSKGIKYDMVIVDYIDCLVSGKSGRNDDAHSSEGTVIRQLESLCNEEEIVLWSAVQSNRAGANAETVEIDMIQGSFKRAQVGHLIISVAKTHQQKELGLATMSILKSRFGGDGKIFKNMTFDNKCMIFDTKESTLLSSIDLEYAKEEKEKQDTQRASEALRIAKENKRKRDEAQAKKEGLPKRNLSNPALDNSINN